MKQLVLPGIRMEPTKSDIKALIAHRLVGFELRQAVRRKKRERRNARRRLWNA
jgi:hypothetical protein